MRTLLRFTPTLLALSALSPAAAQNALTPVASARASPTLTAGSPAAPARTEAIHRRAARVRAPVVATSADVQFAWAVIALIVLLGAAAALHPIAFYIRTVWASRQRIIFDTLRWEAKETYLRIYHRTESGLAPLPSPFRPGSAAGLVSEFDGSPPQTAPGGPTPLSEIPTVTVAATGTQAAEAGATAGGSGSVAAKLLHLLGFRTWVMPLKADAGVPVPPPVKPEPPQLPVPPMPEDLAFRQRVANARFKEVYDRWFGRGRLIAPALIVAAIILCYVLVAALAAARDLLPNATWPAVLHVSPVVLASMTGAYILVSMDTIDRVTRRDLLPDDLNLNALRLAAAVPLGFGFSAIAKDDTAPFVALAITALPLRQVADLLRSIVRQRLGAQAETEVPTLDAPSRLSGVDRAVCERLSTIGVNTITQLAYSDPVQLTMRTSLNFVFVLDVVSQALAWVYLESKLDAIRPMGLRGAFEVCTLRNECAMPDSRWHAQAIALDAQLPTALGMTREQVDNAFHQIADDDRARFLLVAY